MLKYTVLLLAAAAAITPNAAATQQIPRPSSGWAEFQARGASPDLPGPAPTIPAEELESSPVGATMLGSAVGAVVTLAYFSFRNEDTYECNACAERAIVAVLATATGTGIGARASGAGTLRSVVASLAGTVVGTLVGLALIEPLNAGWVAGGVGFTVGQGFTAALLARGDG